MSSAIGAGMGADMLQEILKQKFREVIAQQELAERARSNDQQHALGQGQLEIGRGNLDLRSKEYEASQQPKAPTPLKPMSVGGRIVDPNTGKVIYEAPPVPEKPAAPVRPVSVAPGQRLVDPTTGKVLYAAPDRPQTPDKPGAPQIFYSEDGKPHAIQFGPDGAVEVPLPPGLAGKTAPKPASKTPAEIEAEAAARARGTAAGKEDASGGGLFDAVAGIFNGGAKASPPQTAGPKVGETRTINGVPAKWDGRGWLPVR